MLQAGKKRSPDEAFHGMPAKERRAPASAPLRTAKKASAQKAVKVPSLSPPSFGNCVHSDSLQAKLTSQRIFCECMKLFFRTALSWLTIVLLGYLREVDTFG